MTRDGSVIDSRPVQGVSCLSPTHHGCELNKWKKTHGWMEGWLEMLPQCEHTSINDTHTLHHCFSMSHTWECDNAMITYSLCRSVELFQFKLSILFISFLAKITPFPVSPMLPCLRLPVFAYVRFSSFSVYKRTIQWLKKPHHQLTVGKMQINRSVFYCLFFPSRPSVY